MREQYERWRHVVLPSLLSERTVDRLRRETMGLPSRRVTVKGAEHTEWDELHADARPELKRVFVTEPIRSVVLEVSGNASLTVHQVVCWANRYRVGERIAPHRDANGTMQVLVCLSAPDRAASGGILHLATTDGTLACPLAPGDGVLWEATTIEHWTTPLMATADGPEPERVVLVGRYFL